jgi:adenosine kinase
LAAIYPFDLSPYFSIQNSAFSIAMSTVITGSIAYDYLMSFPGKFTEHFLPEHMNRVSLSFLVDSMDKRRGGCAPNIAYTLALLGERPRLMGTAGQDFGDYRQWLDAAGVDTSLVKVIDGKFTASFFCSTDTESNQIASFYTGAMANAAELSFRTVPDCRLAIISPNDPTAMVQYAEECRALQLPFIWDPGQQCARMSGDELLEGIEGAALVICNDYEFELIRQKTGLDEMAVLERAGALVITKGENGCSVIDISGRTDVPAVAPHRIVDPTGVGDAFRAGFLKGMGQGAAYPVCAQLGTVAAAYALEHLGGQSHAYTWEEFVARYEQTFGALTEVR